MSLDDVFFEVGDFGIYQFIVVILSWWLLMSMPFHNLGTVFFGFQNDHWCSSWPDESCAAWNVTEADCDYLKRSMAVPEYPNSNGTIPQYLQCFKYDTNNYTFSPEEDYTGLESKVVHCDQGWTYDYSMFGPTIVSEWDLVCDKATLPDIAQAVFFAGVCLGSIANSVFADKFGRWKSFLLATLWMSVFSVLSAVAPNFITFVLFRFGIALARDGISVTCSVYLSEVVGPERRGLAVSAMWSSYAIGMWVMAGLAYLTYGWRWLLLTFTVPSLTFAFGLFFLTESPRWLITKGKYKKAEQVFHHIAKVNQKPAPSNAIEKIVESQETQNECKEKQKPKIIDLLKSPVLRSRAFHLTSICFIQSISYYGLTLASDNFGVNIYIAFSFSAVAEFVAYLTCAYVLDGFGRRWTLIISMLGAGFCCVLSPFTPSGTWLTVVLTTGKYLNTISYTTTRLSVTEHFPTNIRSVGSSACVVLSRLGATISPLLLILSSVWEYLPYVVMGVLSVIGGFQGLMLPETSGMSLPDDIEQTKNLRKYSRVSRDETNVDLSEIEKV